MKKLLNRDVLIQTLTVTIFILALIGGYVAYVVNK